MRRTHTMGSTQVSIAGSVFVNTIPLTEHAASPPPLVSHDLPMHRIPPKNMLGLLLSLSHGCKAPLKPCSSAMGITAWGLWDFKILHCAIGVVKGCISSTN